MNEVAGQFFQPVENRQYSYSPTVLGRVCLDLEWEAHAGNFSPRGLENKHEKTAAEFAEFKETF